MGSYFCAFDNRIINADVNAGYTIMKKTIQKAITSDEIEDIGLYPRCKNWYK
ncbi:MAG: hypothetical protein ACTSQP_18465 [Promethearchaeota archaeon]